MSNPKQNNYQLTAQELSRLTPKYASYDYLQDRPADSFLQLMNWVVANFAQELDNQKFDQFIHNQILMNDMFFEFCRLEKVKISCLFKDSIVSWQDEKKQEKFFLQGVFLIQGKDWKFVHSALFHKGNQYEDEISFFNLVSHQEYQLYLNFRNKFTDWSSKEDRINSYIRVVGDDDIYYSRDSSWDELFLPSQMKTQIKSLVENFLSSQDFYREKKIPWKKGLLLWGHPGVGKTSIIRTIIANYDFKPVTIVPSGGDDLVSEAFSYAEEHSPSLLYFEDLDSILGTTIALSTFLNLLDGIGAKNGLFVIATANDVKKLKPSILDRPSRFDCKIEVPLPDKKTALEYLKKWFGKDLSSAKILSLAETAEKQKFSFAYLKELYIASMFEALAKNKKKASQQDVDTAMIRLISEKQMNNGMISTDRYLK